MTALWRSLRTFVPRRAHGALDELAAALAAEYDDLVTSKMIQAYESGQRDVLSTLEAAREEAFRDGMLAVQKRSDFRDLENVMDPEELRHIH